MPDSLMTLEAAEDATGVPVHVIISLAERGRLTIYELETETGTRFVHLDELASVMDASLRQVPVETLRGTPRGRGGRSRPRRKDTNADCLWRVIDAAWPPEREWLSLSEVAELAPYRVGPIGAVRTGGHGIHHKSSYEFAMLTVLCTLRRNYVEHQDPEADRALGDELGLTNRNNGIWKRQEYAGALVRRLAESDRNAGPLRPRRSSVMDEP